MPSSSLQYDDKEVIPVIRRQARTHCVSLACIIQAHVDIPWSRFNEPSLPTNKLGISLEEIVLSRICPGGKSGLLMVNVGW